jgi:adenylylsulfate kinase
MEHIKWHKGQVSREGRAGLLKSPNKVIWLTGLSGSGKSTIAFALEKELYHRGIPSYVLDGDNVRHGLNGDLGFSPEDREENIRRVGELAKLFYDAGLTVIVSFISPYKKDRARAKKLVGKDFIEAFVDCPVEECKKRDPKGLYKKAEEGLIKDLTGVGAPYERSENQDIILNTNKETVEESVGKLLELLDL